MHSELQAQLAFHLTGVWSAGRPEASDALELRPALLAAYRDLTRLRYDFPLVLARSASRGEAVQSLSALMDRAIEDAAPRDGEGERIRGHVLRMERSIRALVAAGGGGSLATLWDTAAGRLESSGEDLLADSLSRARAALEADGEVIDCGKAMPARLFEHLWGTVQEDKARRFREDIERLILKLSDILAAGLAGSEEGRSPERLQAEVGAAHRESFDFEAMSRLLAGSLPKATLPESRRRRIASLISVLESQRFFAAAGERAGGVEPYSFVFASCAAALQAFRERLPAMIALAKAVTVARLEVDNEYVESKHDPFFEEFGENVLGPRGATLFPDYLVRVGAAGMQAAERAELIEALGAGLPLKILLQSDDILEESPVREGHLAFGARARQLAAAAIGLNEVYVLQSSASNLLQLRERILRGLEYPGPALFSVFSGAGGACGGLAPYLVAAAAMESRAFPAFSYDPSAGEDWASRFSLENNPRTDLDWPVHAIAYEDDEHQRIGADLAFTLVDFVACDRRYAKHFATVPRAMWNERMIAVPEYLAREAKGPPEKVPCLPLVGDDGTLHRAIVGEKLIREARRCRESWRSLQELAGIHNSHAERLLARERKAWEEQRAAHAGAAPAPQAAAEAPAPAPAPGVPAQAEPEAEKPRDEPYIETERCTSCNECTQINDKMFVYDANKQASIGDPDAGTYRQLVEAAESCQVSIIHPGRPRNPAEPGLDELLKRAEPFL